MKSSNTPRRLISACLAIAASILVTRVNVYALNNPIITLQENGVGTLQFPGGPATSLPGILAPDPGPGGLPSALSFNLLGPPALVAGDVFVFEPGPPGVISDILRFNPAGTGGNILYPASVLFFSLPGGGQLADTGFPTIFYTNTASIIEDAFGQATYTPTANQPGFVPGFSPTYNITSTGARVPDGGTSALLLLIGIAGLFMAQRARAA